MDSISVYSVSDKQLECIYDSLHLERVVTNFHISSSSPSSFHRPYDEIVFPDDAYVKEGAPNEFSHKFYDGKSRTVDSVIDSIDPSSSELKKRVKTFLDICLDV